MEVVWTASSWNCFTQEKNNFIFPKSLLWWSPFLTVMPISIPYLWLYGLGSACLFAPNSYTFCPQPSKTHISSKINYFQFLKLFALFSLIEILPSLSKCLLFFLVLLVTYSRKASFSLQVWRVLFYVFPENILHLLYCLVLTVITKSFVCLLP